MKKLSLFFCWLLIVSCLLLANSALAVPMMVNIQGKITPAPSPVPDELYFRIFDRAEGGAALGGHENMYSGSRVMNANGVFNVNLELLNTALFTDDRQYWLEIGADMPSVGIVTFTPRQQLVSVPFAITARNVRGGTVVAEATSGSAVEGNATTGYGVEGFSTSGTGVYGQCADGYGVYGSSRNGRGVYGQSANNIGVYGTGATAGGSFESSGKAVVGLGGSDGVYATGTVGVTGIGTTDGVRGYGSSDGGSGVYGENMETTRRVVISRDRLGRIVKSTVTDTDYYGNGVEGVGRVGVSGWGATTGGSFEGTKYGVYATGEVGVYGKGATAGGSFESSGGDGAVAFSTAAGKSGLWADSTLGHGIYAKSHISTHAGVKGVNDSGYGVVGNATAIPEISLTGQRAGVIGEIGDVKGYLGYDNHTPIFMTALQTQAGVLGEANQAAGIGVLAKNTDGGVALEVRGGRIKTAASYTTTIAEVSTGILHRTRCNGNSGRIRVSPDGDPSPDYVFIENDCVNPASVVLVSVQNFIYSEHVFANVQNISDDGLITVKFNKDLANDVVLHFLIIN
jgi:hypothetical protein